MRSAILLSAAVVAVLVLHFGRAATGGWFIADLSPGEDVYHLSLLYERWAHAWLSGEPPLWMDEFQAGYPAPAAWMYGLLYPGLALFLVLPVELAWTWTGILHIAFGAVGLARLARRHGIGAEGAAAAALLFALSELMVGRMACGHVNLVMPLAWVPWVLLHIHGVVAGRRGAVAWLAVCTALGLVSGHVQVWFYAAPLAVAYALFAARGAPRRGPATRFLAAGALVLGLTAVQWVPAVELVAQSDAAPTPVEALDTTSASLLHLATRLVPGALGHRALDGAPAWQTGPYWGLENLEHEYLWIGGPWVLLLALLALRRRDPSRLFWAGVAVVGVLLGVGTHAPWGELVHSMPPLSLGRTPGRALILSALALPVLCGFAVDDATRAPPPTLRGLVAPLGVTLVAMAAATGLVLAALSARGEVMETWLGERSPDAVAWVVVAPAVSVAALGLAVVVAALLLRRDDGPRRWLPVAALGLVAWLGGTPATGAVRAEFFHVDWTRHVPAALRTQRLHLDANRFPMVELHGMRTLRELCHIDTRGFRLLWDAPSGGAAYWLDIGSQAFRGWEEGIFEPPEGVPQAELIEVEQLDALGAGGVYARQGRPLAITDARLAETLAEGTFDAYLMEGDVARSVHAPTRLGSVQRVDATAPLGVAFDVDAPGPALAVFSEKVYPGWQARVDGKPVDVFTANLAFRAVRVPVGQSRVEFVYRPTSYAWGLAGLLLGLLGTGAVLMRARRQGT